MKIQGIKRGKTIELLQSLDIPEGLEITLEFDRTEVISEEERLNRLNEIFGAWQNQPELDEIFAEIDRERHAYHGRQIDTNDE